MKRGHKCDEVVFGLQTASPGASVNTECKSETENGSSDREILISPEAEGNSAILDEQKLQEFTH